MSVCQHLVGFSGFSLLASDPSSDLAENERFWKCLKPSFVKKLQCSGRFQSQPKSDPTDHENEIICIVDLLTVRRTPNDRAAISISEDDGERTRFARRRGILQRRSFQVRVEIMS